VQDSAVYGSSPHQTGVTKRSIGDGHRDAADDVVQYMVVGHFADRVAARVRAVVNRKNHLTLVELARGSRLELRTVYGTEHPLEVVHAGHDGRERYQHHHQGQHDLAPSIDAAPEHEREYEADESGD